MKLLLGAPTSTLVVRANEEHQPLKFERILAPLDGSEEAEKALELVTAIAQQMGTEMILLRVTAPIQKAVGAETAKALAPQVRRQVESYLQTVRERWAKGQPKVATQVESGPVAQSILEFAESQSVDLIALSAHGATNETALPLGGTADKVVRGARRAVLLIRP